jgi:hypothetical protein
MGEKRHALEHRSALMEIGSLGSALLLAASALFSWALAAPGTTEVGPVLHTLQFIPFLLGGPGWAAFFGLFLFGICRARAVTLPQWMVWSGIGLAAVAELATFVLLTISASIALPAARFLGFIWLLFAAAAWARTKQTASM